MKQKKTKRLTEIQILLKDFTSYQIRYQYLTKKVTWLVKPIMEIYLREPINY